jgi:hypothetical protein
MSVAVCKKPASLGGLFLKLNLDGQNPDRCKVACFFLLKS